MRYLERNRRSLGRNSSFGAAMTALALVHSAPALAQEEAARWRERGRGRRPDHCHRLAHRARRVPGADAGDRADAEEISQHLAHRTTSPTSSTRCRNWPARRSPSTRALTFRTVRRASTRSTCATWAKAVCSFWSTVAVRSDSTIFGWVDINTIPQALIRTRRTRHRRRIVSLWLGRGRRASSTSSSTRRWRGCASRATSASPQVGDGFNYSGSVAGGTSFADGRGHVAFNGEIAHQDGIFDVNPNDWP